MNDSYVSLRINKNLKENVHKIFNEYNLSISEAIRMIYEKVQENPDILFNKIYKEENKSEDKK